MDLYLVRHAAADTAATDSPAADAARALTADGREQARLAGRALAVLRVCPPEIWTSPLVRARETATALARELPVPPRLVVVEALAIPGDFRRLQAQLAGCTFADLALVGHAPFLGECVQYWLTGRAHPGLDLAKSSIVKLEGAGFGRATLQLKFVLSRRLNKLLAGLPA
jgi:phosphohistidine phosphatase